MKAGGTKKKGEKLLTVEEFLPIYSQIKKDKDCGAFEDLLEGLKLYDKQENGTMMAAELAHVMLSLGMYNFNYLINFPLINFFFSVILFLIYFFLISSLFFPHKFFSNFFSFFYCFSSFFSTFSQSFLS